MYLILFHFKVSMAFIVIILPLITSSSVIYRSQSLFALKFNDNVLSKSVRVTNYIKQIREEYAIWKHTPNKVTVNLETVLYPFINRPSFILIDNYFNVEIAGTQNVPILLRQLVFHVVNITTENYDGTIIDILSLGWSIFNKKVTKVSVNELACTHSKYVIKSDPFGRELCIDINFSSFITQIKPWNYAAHISLLRPKCLSSDLGVGRHDPNLKIDLPFKPVLMSFTTPSLQITVLTDGYIMVNDELVLDLLWQLVSVIPYDVIVMPIRKITRKFVTNIEITKISRICYSCSNASPIPLKIYSYKNYWKPNKEKFPDSNEILPWMIHNSLTNSGRFVASFMRQIDQCNDHIESLGHNWLQIKFKSLVDRLSHVHSHVWKSILKNYTYHSNPKDCVNGELTEKKHYYTYSRLSLYSTLFVGPNPQQYTWFVEDTVSNLQFIACGDRGNSMLKFEAFIDAFDGTIWIFTIITLVVGPIILSCLHSKGLHSFNFEDVSRDFLTLLSFYLEKDDFRLEKELSLRLRLVFIFYLLGAQVISSAYKNDNVNRMIQPRLPLTYDTFRELLRNNFSIYSRSSDVYFPSRFHENRITTNISKLEIRSDNFRMTEMVTGVQVSSEMNAIVNSNVYLLFPNGMKPLDELVYYNSMIHPALSDVLENVTRKYIKNITVKRWTLVERSTFSMMYTTQFWKAENELIREEFRKCNKVAFLLPNFKCQQMKIESSGLSKKLGNVHLGKETYFKGYIAYRIEGRTPLYIFQRIEYIKNSGIMDWWTQLIGKMGINMRHQEKSEDGHDGITKATTMEGNISTVFVILLGGCLSAILIFFVEFVFKHCTNGIKSSESHDSKWAWVV